MFVRKPLYLLEGDDEPGGGDPEDAPEAPDNADPAAEGEDEPDSPEEPDETSDEEPFDAARALAKIKKVNSEARAQRKRAEVAEEKVKGLEPAARDAALQRVARRLALPDNDDVDLFLSRLQGDTVEELAEDAERLLSLMTIKAPATKTTSRRPAEQLRGGSEPEVELEETDPKKLAAGVRTRY